MQGCQQSRESRRQPEGGSVSTCQQQCSRLALRILSLSLSLSHTHTHFPRSLSFTCRPTALEPCLRRSTHTRRSTVALQKRKQRERVLMGCVHSNITQAQSSSAASELNLSKAGKVGDRRHRPPVDSSPDSVDHGAAKRVSVADCCAISPGECLPAQPGPNRPPEAWGC